MTLVLLDLHKSGLNKLVYFLFFSFDGRVWTKLMLLNGHYQKATRQEVNSVTLGPSETTLIAYIFFYTLRRRRTNTLVDAN